MTRRIESLRIESLRIEFLLWNVVFSLAMLATAAPALAQPARAPQNGTKAVESGSSASSATQTAIDEVQKNSMRC